MKKYLFLLSLVCLFSNVSYGQAYEDLVGKASMLYKQQKYLLSAKIYQKALAIQMDQSKDVYEAAKAWAMADGQSAEAFKLLKYCIDKGWIKEKQLIQDKAFDKIRDTEEWAVLKSMLAQQPEIASPPKDTTNNQYRN